MINFSCIQDLIDIANNQERTIDDIVVEYEATHSFKSVIYIKENMQTIWQVMKESAEIALSLVRALLPKEEEFFKTHDFHLHVPEGAVPKDGPSAGVTMTTAIYSAVTGKKVLAKVAMTGEITLRGRVLPIGGLKEKLLAAKQAGIQKVVVPKENKPDVEELEEEITEGMQIVFAGSISDVLKEALVQK